MGRFVVDFIFGFVVLLLFWVFFLLVEVCLFLNRHLIDILECITLILVLELFTCKKVFMILSYFILFGKLQCAIFVHVF